MDRKERERRRDEEIKIIIYEKEHFDIPVTCRFVAVLRCTVEVLASLARRQRPAVHHIQHRTWSHPINDYDGRGGGRKKTELKIQPLITSVNHLDR